MQENKRRRFCSCGPIHVLHDTWRMHLWNIRTTSSYLRCAAGALAMRSWYAGITRTDRYETILKTVYFVNHGLYNCVVLSIVNIQQIFHLHWIAFMTSLYYRTDYMQVVFYSLIWYYFIHLESLFHSFLKYCIKCLFSLVMYFHFIAMNIW